MIITTYDYINMILLVSTYAIGVAILTGISALIVNHFWIDPLEVKSTQYITVESKHYQSAA